MINLIDKGEFILIFCFTTSYNSLIEHIEISISLYGPVNIACIDKFVDVCLLCLLELETKKNPKAIKFINLKPINTCDIQKRCRLLETFSHLVHRFYNQKFNSLLNLFLNK